MLKKYKWSLLFSSVVTLLPMVLGVVAEGFLPEQITVHWGFDGMADGWMRSSTVFFLLPPILLAIHWLCVILSLVLDQNATQNKKVVRLVFWVLPGISLLTCGTVFAVALGETVSLSGLMLFMALFFIVLGNYLPKTTRNVTMGIKIKWTLANDANWQATHRFAGKVFVIAGALCLPAVFLPDEAFLVTMAVLVAVCVGSPVLYSYRFYKKQLAEGSATKESYETAYGALVKNKKVVVAVSVVLLVALGVLLPVLMLTGDVEVSFGEDAFTVDSVYWSALTVRYEDIEEMDYRVSGVDGQRISGFGSPRLLLGLFQNEEYGNYTRYTYNKDLPCIVLTVKGKTLVFGGADEEATRALYDRLVKELY